MMTGLEAVTRCKEAMRTALCKMEELFVGAHNVNNNFLGFLPENLKIN